ncbi:hypothetical protein POM88_051643 [Heracleum sosnowskyi]|uniref:Uncharacterized protein n=1 Tax=Heracleum sosnowskyi TaxID=360622 RepID=A0AAD8GZW6_9APIA|nr:hypothetical protein POM88_051643 [Heracleum sosnowskyi]
MNYIFFVKAVGPRRGCLCIRKAARNARNNRKTAANPPQPPPEDKGGKKLPSKSTEEADKKPKWCTQQPEFIDTVGKFTSTYEPLLKFNKLVKSFGPYKAMLPFVLGVIQFLWLRIPTKQGHHFEKLKPIVAKYGVYIGIVGLIIAVGIIWKIKNYNSKGDSS